MSARELLNPRAIISRQTDEFGQQLTRGFRRVASEGFASLKHHEIVLDSTTFVSQDKADWERAHRTSVFVEYESTKISRVHIELT